MKTFTKKKLDLSVSKKLCLYGQVPCLDIQKFDDDDRCFVDTWEELISTFEPLDKYLSEICGRICKSAVAAMQRDSEIKSLLWQGDRALRCFFDNSAELVDTVVRELSPEVDVCELSSISKLHDNPALDRAKHKSGFIIVLAGMRFGVSDKYSMFVAFPRCPEHMFGPKINEMKDVSPLQLTKCHNPNCKDIATDKCKHCDYLRYCPSCYKNKMFKGHRYTVCKAINEMMVNP